MRQITCLIISLTILVLNISAENETNNVTDKKNIKDQTEELISLLGINLKNTENERLQYLNNKLKKIDRFTIDKEQYALLMRNITSDTTLRDIHFYKSLKDEDDIYKFLTQDESKNIYMQLKDRMNRVDIMEIVSEKEEESVIIKSARRSMGGANLADNDEMIDSIVLSIIDESGGDKDSRRSQSIYWDQRSESQDTIDGRRLFKGDETIINDYAFMVSIDVMGKLWCGGMLYWRDLVITSASCLQLIHNNRFFRENPSVLQVRIGSNHSRSDGEIYDAVEVFFHPNYDPRTFHNNIAIIRLGRQLIFNYHTMAKIIPISTSPDSIPTTAEVLLLGWGVNKIDQNITQETDSLQRMFLPVYPNTDCKEVYGESYITETMFCAGKLTSGEGACEHDVGGPAILDGKLVGIISLGSAVCGQPNSPTVFTLVGAFADWIETTNETIPSDNRGKGLVTASTESSSTVNLEDDKKIMRSGNQTTADSSHTNGVSTDNTEEETTLSPTENITTVSDSVDLVTNLSESTIS